MGHTPKPLESMSLGDYLRWLASTLDEKHAPVVRERAKQADDLLAACKRALELLNEQNEGEMPSPTIVRLTAAIAKAEPKS